MTSIRNTIEDWEIHRSAKENRLSTVSVDDMVSELEHRMMGNNFPLDVFHPNIKPFLQHLENDLGIPPSYIGATMLSVFSTAIGNAYMLDMGTLGKMSLGVWATLVGLSSQGKSLIRDLIYSPIKDIQKGFDQEWKEVTEGMSNEARQQQKMKTIMYRDIHVATLTRGVLPDNPKGLMKDADEMIEWINGLNSLSNKEGTDEQFWITAWDGSDYPLVRSGKDKIVIPRLYVNVFGGIQPSILYKLFKNERDTTGFVFRLLFAVPKAYKVARPDIDFIMPEQLTDIHKECLHTLFHGLPVEDPYDYRRLVMDTKARKLYKEWRNKQLDEIDLITDLKERGIHSGIQGKINAYLLRFSALLHLSDKAYGSRNFQMEEIIEAGTVARAIKLADYFYASAVEVNNQVNEDVFVTPEARRYKEYEQQHRSLMDIAQAEFSKDYKRNPESAKTKARRRKNAIMKLYPNFFGIREK